MPSAMGDNYMSYFTIFWYFPVFPTVWGNTLISRLFNNPAIYANFATLKIGLVLSSYDQIYNLLSSLLNRKNFLPRLY